MAVAVLPGRTGRGQAQTQIIQIHTPVRHIHDPVGGEGHHSDLALSELLQQVVELQGAVGLHQLLRGQSLIELGSFDGGRIGKGQLCGTICILLGQVAAGLPDIVLEEPFRPLRCQRRRNRRSACRVVQLSCDLQRLVPGGRRCFDPGFGEQGLVVAEEHGGHFIGQTVDIAVPGEHIQIGLIQIGSILPLVQILVQGLDDACGDVLLHHGERTHDEVGGSTGGNGLIERIARVAFLDHFVQGDVGMGLEEFGLALLLELILVPAGDPEISSTFSPVWGASVVCAAVWLGSVGAGSVASLLPPHPASTDSVITPVISSASSFLLFFIR